MSKRVLGKVIGKEVCLVFYQVEKKTWYAFSLKNGRLVASWK